MKIVFDITKMPLNYIIINYYCLENVNEFSLTAILQFITELIWIILNIQRPLATFLANVVNSWVSPFWILSYFLLLYTTTLSTALLLYYYYCEYWMLDHITRLYAVDMCTNWVVLGSVIIESEQKIFDHRNFTVNCYDLRNLMKH